MNLSDDFFPNVMVHKTPVVLEEVGTFLELAGNGDLKLKCKLSGEVKTFKKGGPVGFCLKMLGTKSLLTPWDFWDFGDFWTPCW